jgi:hypothetical protein
MYTISNAVQNLDDNIQHHQDHQTVQQKADMITALTQPNSPPQNLDGQPRQSPRPPQGVQIVIQEIARRFRPYNAPPPPLAFSDAELEAREAEAAAAEATEEQQARELEVRIEGQDAEQPHVQTVILNVHQNAEDLQEGQFFTHRSPSISIQQPHSQDNTINTDVETRDISEPSHQHMTYLERRQRNNKMYAISVKRQRRLKMKKHKYKKLMRKTRNLRRRQDKL